MIKASELRIGNWVTVGENSNFQVKIINGKNKFEPIPITAELLKKTNFELDADESKHRCWHYRLGYNEWDQDFFLQLTDPDDEIDMALIYSRDVPESSCQIINFPKYLHQLQNLFFALTGTELETNL